MRGKEIVLRKILGEHLLKRYWTVLKPISASLVATALLLIVVSLYEGNVFMCCGVISLSLIIMDISTIFILFVHKYEQKNLL